MIARASLAASFAALYARAPDPWRVRSRPYEQRKYAMTMRALPRGRFADVLEIGCSIGGLSSLLGRRAERLTGIDVSRRALMRARRRNPDARFARMQVPARWPEGRFDLIVVSEVLYFLLPAEVGGTAQRCLASLRPGGHVLLVNWTGPTDTPCTGSQAAALFAAACAGRLRREAVRRTPRYRIDLLG